MHPKNVFSNVSFVRVNYNDVCISKRINIFKFEFKNALSKKKIG